MKNPDRMDGKVVRETCVRRYRAVSFNREILRYFKESI